jgi:hypothetical protein
MPSINRAAFIESGNERRESAGQEPELNEISRSKGNVMWSISDFIE